MTGKHIICAITICRSKATLCGFDISARTLQTIPLFFFVGGEGGFKKSRNQNLV